MHIGFSIYTNYFLAFTIELKDISNFVLGMLTGFVFLSLAIAGLFASSQNQTKKRILRTKMQPLAMTQVAKMIDDKQKGLSEVAKVADNAYFRVTVDLAFELMNEIAKYYFPESKYPLYELSAQEILDLNRYITKRIDKMMSGKVVWRLKNVRISTIIDIVNKKKAFDNSKLMKINRQLKISKFWSYASAVFNYANPIYWFRKLAMKPATTLVIKEICKLIIKIVGEETDKVYGKKIYEEAEDQEAIEQELVQNIAEAVEAAPDVETAPIEAGGPAELGKETKEKAKTNVK